MDRPEEERLPPAASPSASARESGAPALLKADTFRQNEPLPSPATEPYKVGNRGFFPSVKPLRRHLSLYGGPPPLAGSEAFTAFPFRRSCSSASRSEKAAARWSGGGASKVVLYSTSLRGIRRTYQDCCTVRNILRGFRVAVDERDVSMDCSLRKELQGRLGSGPGKPSVTLPQVFVGERCLGGAEEIQQLHEGGELGKLLEGLPRQDPRFVCESCGGIRFLPCIGCSGSRKVFDENEGQLRRCSDCNENGLVRCPDCTR